MHLTDFQRIVAMNTIESIGVGLVNIFIPIYLLELGFSLPTVIAWLLTLHLSILVGAFGTVFLSNIIGLVRCWYIRIVFTALLFSGLLLLPSHPEFLFVLAIISGIEAALFWIPYNILIVRKTEDATMGSSLAFVSNIGSVVGILVPGIAALLIVYFGYNLLFAIAFFFILLSIIPVLPLYQEKTEFRFNRSAMLETIRTNRHFILPEIFDNLGQDAQVVWTLFVFIAALTVLDIGLLGVLAGLIGMIVTYIAGRLIDRWNAKAVIRSSAIATTLMWLASYAVAVYIPTPFMLYLVTALRGLVLGVFVTAYGAIMFNRARSGDAQFLVLREIPTILGRTLLFLIVLALLAIGEFELVFLAVAFLSLYFWFNDLDALVARPDVGNKDTVRILPNPRSNNVQ